MQPSRGVISGTAKQTLAAAADRRLNELRRRSEWVVALARLAWVGVAAFVLITRASRAAALPIESKDWHHFNLGLLVLYSLGSIAIVVALRRGWFPRHLRLWVLLDGVTFGAALLVWRLAYGVGFYRQTGLMTVITTVCIFLGICGAQRLEVATARIGAAMAIVLFLIAAQWADLTPIAMFGQLLMLFAFGLLSGWLTGTVASAVRGEVARTTLSRFLPAAVLESAHSDPAQLAVPRLCDATVMLTDVRGFSSWAEHRAPADVLTFISHVHGELAAAVASHGGYVDKFLGDGMLAVFGVLEGGVDHAARAVRCAAAIQQRVRSMDVRVGIGIHSGPVVAGCIGTGERLEFTVLGDTVNTASRLQSHTKEVGVAVLVSGQTADLAADPTLRACGETVLRGKEKAIRLFTLTGD